MNITKWTLEYILISLPFTVSKKFNQKMKNINISLHMVSVVSEYRAGAPQVTL